MNNPNREYLDKERRLSLKLVVAWLFITFFRHFYVVFFLFYDDRTLTNSAGFEPQRLICIGVSFGLCSFIDCAIFPFVLIENQSLAILPLIGSIE